MTCLPWIPPRNSISLLNSIVSPQTWLSNAKQLKDCLSLLWKVSLLVLFPEAYSLPALCLLETPQSNWWARDQPLVFATQSLRCYGQLDQSLSRSQRRRPGLLDEHNLLPRKWLVTWIEEHLLSSGLYTQTVAGRFFHVIVTVVYCAWISPWL